MSPEVGILTPAKKRLILQKEAPSAILPMAQYEKFLGDGTSSFKEPARYGNWGEDPNEESKVEEGRYENRNKFHLQSQ